MFCLTLVGARRRIVLRRGRNGGDHAWRDSVPGTSDLTKHLWWSRVPRTQTERARPSAAGVAATSGDLRQGEIGSAARRALQTAGRIRLSSVREAECRKSAIFPGAFFYDKNPLDNTRDTYRVSRVGQGINFPPEGRPPMAVRDVDYLKCFGKRRRCAYRCRCGLDAYLKYRRESLA